MHNDVLIAGFGGQGVLLAGKLLAWAGMIGGRHVTWFPSYGAEMRGGTANCTVIIADDEIGSPVVDSPGALVALNDASAVKFSGKVVRGGVIILNSSLVKTEIKKPGVKIYSLPASELAEGLGNAKVANMVMLGAYLRLTGSATVEDVARALDETLPARNKSLLPMNIAALQKGYSLVAG
ncbi:MAG: 2-oxoacid:acceptor oxidoreductase family protein [Nitrospirota bacterium]